MVRHRLSLSFAAFAVLSSFARQGLPLPLLLPSSAFTPSHSLHSWGSCLSRPGLFALTQDATGERVRADPKLKRNDGSDDGSDEARSKNSCFRRQLSRGLASACLFASTLLLSPPLQSIPPFLTSAAHAAPPIAVIAEELGYYPVQNRDGRVVYIPKRVQRESTRQAVELAKRIHSKGIVMLGTYWCPHTTRQKELFGKEAWELVDYIECSPQGYKADPSFCASAKVQGYPSWIVPEDKDDDKKRTLGGERSLGELAALVDLKSFRSELEESNAPSPLGQSACP